MGFFESMVDCLVLFHEFIFSTLKRSLPQREYFFANLIQIMTEMRLLQLPHEKINRTLGALENCHPFKMRDIFDRNLKLYDYKNVGRLMSATEQFANLTHLAIECDGLNANRM